MPPPTGNLACPPASYCKQESLKKHAYEQRVREVEHSSFTPLVLYATSSMAKEATVFYKRLKLPHALLWSGTIHTPLPWPGWAAA